MQVGRNERLLPVSLTKWITSSTDTFPRVKERAVSLSAGHEPSRIGGSLSEPALARSVIVAWV